ncbi:MAG TPA: dihydrodipicolinate synthase family protein [Xanthobacteraceae bacterium]|nr:dihydrodipicolinate synthase family protein [Xanthobacteraceae bacterium]
MPPVRLHRNFRGNLPIVPTPFHQNGELALDDIGMMVDYYQRCGVDGLTILGVMGEAFKLSAAETKACIDEFLRCAKGRLAIVVGVSDKSLARSAEVGSYAVENGADAVMLLPLQGLKTDDAVVGFFERYAKETGGRVPICVQDDPPVSNVELTVAAWCRISKIEPVIMLKHEPFPGLQKLSQILEARKNGEARQASILTSSNGMYLPQELERGCDGSMIGVAYADAITQMTKQFWAGDSDKMFDLHDALLPLIRHEKQAAFGLSVRKEILRRRGAISTGTVRYPGAALDARDLAELDRLIERFEARLQALSVSLEIRQAA